MSADDHALNAEESLDALIESPQIHAIAALIDECLPQRGRGAKRKHPTWLWVIYLSMISHETSSRAVERFMRQTWVRSRLARACEADGLAGDPARLKLVGMRRWQFHHLRERLIQHEPFWAAAQDRFGETAADLARAMGICSDPNAGYTNPPLSACLIGDGKNIAAASSHPRVDRETGEIGGRRYDPDARTYTDGKGERVFGHQSALISARNGFPNENLVLAFDAVRPGQGGEAGTAMSLIPDIARRLEARALIYDTALRGTHIDMLYVYALLGISPVASKTAASDKTKRVPKDAPAGTAQLSTPDGTTYTVNIHTIDGHPHLVDFDAKGKQFLIELNVKKIEHRPRKKGGSTFYGILETPTGEQVRIRYDTTDEDRANGFNRAENLRPFPPGTDRYDALYNYRPTIESMNAQIERSLGEWHRAHSYTLPRVQLDVFGFALLNNAKALYINRRRQALAEAA